MHCLVCDPVLILVKPGPIGCPIKCMSLSLCSCEWRYLLSYVIASMFIHGHYPDELLLSTISSLPKDKYGHVCSKHRGISPFISMFY